MMDFFHAALYVPLYNLLVFLVDSIPGGDVGLAVVVVTLIVKVVLAPFTFSMARTQKKMQAIAPHLERVKTEHKDDKERQMKETLALYKEHGVNPFAGILILFVQLPILIALYAVFNSHILEHPDFSLLYSFVPAPESLSPLFLGFLPIAGGSLLLAALAAAAQYLYSRLMPTPASGGTAGSAFQDEMNRAMALQMRYVFPIFMGIIAYAAGGAIALYLITSSLFGAAQQLLVNRLVLPVPAAK